MVKNQRFLQFLRLDGDRLGPMHFVLLLSIIACIFLSRYLLTISIISLFVSVFLGKSVQLFTQSRPINNQWFNDSNYDVRWMIWPIGIFVLYLLSFLYSANLEAAFASAKVKILFVILPFSLWQLKNISRKQQSYLMHWFVFIGIIGACWSLLQIPLQNIDLQDSYASGGVLPTWMHHIRFSLLIAFASSICFFLTFRQPFPRLLPRYVYLIMALFLAAYLHILAVRSGLIGLYLSMLFLLLLSFGNRRKIHLKILALVTAMVIFAGAYFMVPSLKSKVDYTLWSLQIYKSGDNDIPVYSDSRRLISYEAAIDVILANPWFGVGIGDVKEEVQQFYHNNYPRAEENYIQPHNQYLWTATAIGIPGAIYLILFNIALVFRHVRVKNWLMVAFNLIWVASFMVEDTLEMQIGVAAYLFFNYLGWNISKQQLR